MGICRQKQAEFLPNLHHNTLLVMLTDVILSSDITPSLEPIHHPRNRLSALNFTGGWFH